jgi:hypothetical protein
VWAIEGCNGVGKHLSQRLLAAGERVVDVSTRRAALVRVYAGGTGRKNDDTDAYSIAMVALHTPDLPEVTADSRAQALRLVSQRRKELVGLRTQCVCRIHRDLVALLPGGAPRKLTVAKAKELLATVRPRDEVGKLRRQLIADQIRDLEHWDRKIAAIDTQLVELVDDTPPRCAISTGSVRSPPPSSWVRSSTSPDSGTRTTSRPTTAPPRPTVVRPATRIRP